jgi:hypothetical protein
MMPVPADGRRPVSVTVSGVLALVGAFLQLVWAVDAMLGLGTSLSIVERALQRRNNADPQLSEQGLHAALIFGIVVAAIFTFGAVVLSLLSAIQLLRGRGWARVLLIIVTALSLLYVLRPLGLATIAVLIAATVFAWLNPSTRWFRAVKARRRGV